MERNSKLVDFERGSTFGGIMTAFVLVGFIGILVYDLSENIRNKPYTFEVRDRYMSPEETRNAKVIMGQEEKSQQLMFGFYPHFENGTYDGMFDVLDNDYFEVVSAYWDTEKNSDENKSWHYIREAPKLKYCSKEKDHSIEFVPFLSIITFL